MNSQLRNDEARRWEPSASQKKGNWVRSGFSEKAELSPGMAKLSSFTRSTLLGIRSIKDPFDEDTERAIKNFRDYLVNSSPDKINLEECSLLLQASTKIFGMEVKLAAQHVNNLAAFVTNTAKDSENSENPEGESDGKKKRGRQKKKGVEGEGDVQPGTSGDPPLAEGQNGSCSQSSLENLPQNSESSVVPNSVDGNAGQQLGISDVIGSDDSERTKTCESNAAVEPGGTSLLDSVAEGIGSLNQAEQDLTPVLPSVCDISNPLLDDNSRMEVTETTLTPSQPELEGDRSQVSAEEIPVAPDEIAVADGILGDQEIKKPVSRKRDQKVTTEGFSPKKRKLDGFVPPVLFSIYDLDCCVGSGIDFSEGDNEPPILYPEVDLWDGQFDPSADPDKPLPDQTAFHSLVNGLGSLNVSAENACGDKTTNGGAGSSAVESSDMHNDVEVANSSATRTECERDHMTASEDVLAGSTSLDDTNNTVQTNGDVLATPRSDVVMNSLELPVLTPDDQQEIQNCIYQLHYLPFTCELTKAELAKTFSNTVEHLEEIFKKYNMPFNRHLLKAATVVCADMVSSLSSRPSMDMDEHRPDDVSVLSEIFSQGDPEQSKEGTLALINSEKTILERTREKSVAESRKTIQKRLEEMQRLIVPKYIQWPLITENTPEFFQRVKQFEQKMKKVLADEEKKETFDVTKYEIEVLNATALESLEEDATIEMEDSDDSRAVSPRSPCSLEDSSKIQRMLSPVSLSNGPPFENGRKWVPLSSVFHHMKKFNRNECARHFYAVLALLSSQNLDMNYDRHFSQESAALVTTKFDHTQDTKYPRGVKIMTSRCPDADKEEIYVTALAAKSCNESFRALISNEMHLNGLPDGNLVCGQKRTDQRLTSGVSSVSNGDIQGDSEEEFVPVSCTAFTGNLFGGRRSRKN